MPTQAETYRMLKSYTHGPCTPERRLQADMARDWYLNHAWERLPGQVLFADNSVYVVDSRQVINPTDIVIG